MVNQNKIQIISNTQIHDNYYQLRLRSDKGFESVIPGQFVMIRLSDNYAPLLRRPFSIHNVFQDDNGVYCFDILYKVIGKGTRVLSEYLSNQFIDVLGPIGNGFHISESIKNVLLVSGGIGVAPMLFLTKCLLENGTKCHLINGGRTADDVLCTKHFQSMGIEVSIYTDDGSSGTSGFVTDNLAFYLKQKEYDMVYACGPQPMLSKVSKISKQMNVSCQISLESYMACGMGACLGCAVLSKKTNTSYLHVCNDGPVFSSERVNLENNV